MCFEYLQVASAAGLPPAPVAAGQVRLADAGQLGVLRLGQPRLPVGDPAAHRHRLVGRPADRGE